MRTRKICPTFTSDIQLITNVDVLYVQVTSLENFVNDLPPLRRYAGLNRKHSIVC